MGMWRLKCIFQKEGQPRLNMSSSRHFFPDTFGEDDGMIFGVNIFTDMLDLEKKRRV